MAFSNTVSRQEARAQGLKHFATGKPCLRGHVASRFVSFGGCTACGKEDSVTWASNNKQKKRTSDRAYRDLNLAKIKERDALYYAANCERIKAATKEYELLNKDAVRVTKQKWAAKNKDKISATQRRYRQKHPDKVNARAAVFRAAKLHFRTFPLSLSQKAEIGALYELSKKLSEETGVLHHVDHMVPLAGSNVSGLHVPWNLRVVPAKENQSKGNRLVAALERAA